MLTPQEKRDWIKALQLDAVNNNSELIAILEQDLADGGSRFEQLYYASYSHYG